LKKWSIPDGYTGRRSSMRKAVHFGPGSIGMGFFGQIYHESGYQIVFVGRTREKVDLLNLHGEYPLMLSSRDGTVREILIEGVKAISYLDKEKLEDEISSADILSTAVGASALPSIAGPIAAGLMARWRKQNFKPLNILLGENMVDADKYFAGLVEAELREPDLIKTFRDIVGVVDTSVERLVPVIADEMRFGHPLRTWASDTFEFPVDKNAFKGEIPDLKYMILLKDFEFYKKRKIFVFNSGHSIMAYLGHVKGYKRMSQAYKDPAVVQAAYHAMFESASALCSEFGIPLDETLQRIRQMTLSHSDSLDDEIARVGRDPLRKLSDNERLIGPAKLATRHGHIPLYLGLATAAALHFDAEHDTSCMVMRKMIEVGGPNRVLREVSKLNEESCLCKVILSFYRILSKRGLHNE